MYTRFNKDALEKYALKKPRGYKTDPSDVFKIISKNPQLMDGVKNFIKSPYLYWDDIRYKPRPSGVNDAEWWAIIKFVRKIQSLPSIIREESGNYFRWIKLPEFEKFFHGIDLNTGGSISIFSRGAEVDEAEKHRFISRGVIEEAIASSQLEGANTTREAAKKMLREGKKPKTLGEKMILNNYNSMMAIEEKYRNQKLTKELLIELHAMIVTDTDVDPKEIGRLRRDRENIVVTGQGDKINVLYHRPPRIRFVTAELDRFIKFANDELDEDTFVHPLIKAVMIHFWIAYLHPFTNGNGRLARLLFYWYLLRKDYWAFAYLPISTIIKRSPSQYKMAYIYAEQDDLDLTYFIDYHLRKIMLAIESFTQYVKSVAQLNKKMNITARTKYKLNDRQIGLLQFFYKKKDEHTTASIHQNIYRVSRITAMKDLKGLERLGFVTSKKLGKEVYYYGSDAIHRLF